MDVVEFAAQRAARLEDADKEIGPFVETALGNFGKPGAWADVVQGASVLWLETYEKESPDTDSAQAMEDFQIMLIESLGKTTPPSQPPTRAEIDRVTRWVGTVTVNDATVAGSAAAGTRIKRWVTMHDPAVREMHRVVDGQVRSTGGKFDVGGHKLRYPGEPVGPPEVWINCRCLAAPGNVRRSMSMTASAEEIELPEAEDEEVTEEVIAEEPLVDDLVDVPWHAVLAPEGVPTGDGRMFAVGSLSTRDLPLPITYQYETAEGHMKAVVVARMDEAWLDEASGQYRARGVFWMNEPMAHKAIDGIAQGFLRGLSVDVDDIEVEQPDVPEDATDEDIMAAMMGEGVTVFSKARIAGASIVHIPAFSEAYIALGPEFEDEVELTEDEVTALTACGCIDGVGEEDFVEALMAAAMRPLPETFATGGIVNQRTGRLVGESGPEVYVPFAIDPDGDRVIPGVGKYWVDETGRARAPRGQKPELEAAYQRELDKAFAPGTKDGPGWITHPRATARIRRYWVRGKGAAKIGWGAPGDFNRCRSQLAKYVRNPDWLAGLCANMHKEALGIWPAQHHSSTVPALLASATPAPMFTLVASGAPVEARYFKNPELTEPVGIVIDGDHIYGYIATWNVCHIGIPGKCEKAPSSPSNYAYYRTGTVQTDEGPIPVGSITMGTGHADDKGDGRVAAAHYDNTGSVIADVATGEDTIGIWFSGRLRDTATEEQRYQLAAAGRLSGDWRWIGRGLELVAALAVNVPGFPIPRPALVASAGEVVTVTGFGIVEPDESSLVASALDAEMIAAISRTAVEEYIDQTEKRKVRDERLAALAPFRKQAREAAIMRLRGKIGE